MGHRGAGHGVELRSAHVDDPAGLGAAAGLVRRRVLGAELHAVGILVGYDKRLLVLCLTLRCPNPCRADSVYSWHDSDAVHLFCRTGELADAYL